MKNIHTWLSEYGESHQNHTNKIIHWICVPVIFFSITALLYSVKLPWHPWNVAMIVLVAVIIYYLRLSVPIGLGMMLFSSVCLLLCHWMERFVPFRYGHRRSYYLYWHGLVSSMATPLKERNLPF